MIALGPWLAFLGLSLIAVLTPGPTMLAIVGHAIARGVRATLPMVLGNALGIAAMVATAMAGVAGALSRAPTLRIAIPARRRRRTSPGTASRSGTRERGHPRPGPGHPGSVRSAGACSSSGRIRRRSSSSGPCFLSSSAPEARCRCSSACWPPRSSPWSSRSRPRRPSSPVGWFARRAVRRSWARCEGWRNSPRRRGGASRTRGGAVARRPLTHSLTRSASPPSRSPPDPSFVPGTGESAGRSRTASRGGSVGVRPTSATSR